MALILCMTSNKEDKASPIDQRPIHPQFEANNVSGFGAKKEHFLPEWFAQKFSISLMKLLELKGAHLTLLEHEHEVSYRPQLESRFEDLLTFEIIHETKQLGFLYLEVNFVSLLIHKVLGGSDKVTPTKATLPLGKIEAKGLETAFGIFNLSLREALKRSFPLREIDFIQLKGPIDEFQFPHHLENSDQFFNESFIFSAQGQIQIKLCVLLDCKLFHHFGK